MNSLLPIAHRLTTVRHCDVIIELEHGKVGHKEHMMNSSRTVPASAIWLRLHKLA